MTTLQAFCSHQEQNPADYRAEQQRLAKAALVRDQAYRDRVVLFVPGNCPWERLTLTEWEDES